ncbi:hypothetical protein ACFL2Y_01355, partial [Candidatus Omnitrophota bacterium]
MFLVMLKTLSGTSEVGLEAVELALPCLALSKISPIVPPDFPAFVSSVQDSLPLDFSTLPLSEIQEVAWSFNEPWLSQQTQEAIVVAEGHIDQAARTIKDIKRSKERLKGIYRDILDKARQGSANS